MNREDFLRKFSEFGGKMKVILEQKKTLEEEIHAQTEKTEKLEQELKSIRKDLAMKNGTIKEMCKVMMSTSDIEDKLKEITVQNFEKEKEIDKLRRAQELDKKQSCDRIKKLEKVHAEEKRKMEENHSKQFATEKRKYEESLKEKGATIIQLREKMAEAQKEIAEKLNKMQHENELKQTKMKLQMDQQLHSKGAREEKSQHIFRLKLQEKQTQHEQEVAELNRIIEELRKKDNTVRPRKMKRN